MAARTKGPSVGRTVGRETGALVLHEMLRECERTIDHQVRALEEHDDKTAHMLTLTVAALGGGVALVGLAFGSFRADLDVFFVASAVLAGAINITSVLLLVGAYVGFRRHTEVHIGPSVAWIADKANDAEWSVLDHYLCVVKDYPSYYEWNTQRSQASAARRRRGVQALCVAVAGYAFAFAYVLVRRIGG